MAEPDPELCTVHWRSNCQDCCMDTANNVLTVARIAEVTAQQDLVVARANATVALRDLRAELGLNPEENTA